MSDRRSVGMAMDYTCGPVCAVSIMYDFERLHWVVTHRTGSEDGEERVELDDTRYFLTRDRFTALRGWLRSIHAYKEGRLLRVIPNG